MSTANSVSRVDPAAFHWPEGPGAGTSGDTEHTVSGTGPVTDGGPGEAVRRITDAARAHDGAGPLDEATLLSLRHHGITSSALWLGHRDGATEDAVGFALAGTVPGSAANGSTVEVNLVVEPASRRTGVGSALASAVLDAFPGAALAAWSHGNHPGAAALAARFGFDRVRDLWVMRRRLGAGAEPLPELASPGAVEIRTFEPGRDEDAFLAVNAEAFVHHPEQGRMTRADLEQRMAEPWFDPAGFFLAEPADRPRDVQAEAEVESPSLLGFHWTKVHPGVDGRPPVGEVYVVGVSPAAQGMGLGRLLTLTGLHHLDQAGLEEVILYVEADNAPAVAVYQGLGFTHADEDTHVMYRRPAPR